MNFKLIILCCISFFGYTSCLNKKFIRQGIIKEKKFFINVDDPTILPIQNNLETKIWFNDSCVIYEVQVMNSITVNSDKGVYKTESYDLFKYTYLDLRTLMCTDYNNLSDTAMPICKYKLKPEESLGWKFYADKNKRDIQGQMYNLPDTVINKKLFKRISFLNSDISDGHEFIYYLDCKGKESIFHINRSLDEMYPGCITVRSDLRSNINNAYKKEINSAMVFVFSTEFISIKLTNEETRIFEAWEKNSKNIMLPVLSLDEIEYKYPPPSPK